MSMQTDRKKDAKPETEQAARAPAEDAPAPQGRFSSRGALPPVALDEVQAGPSASERAYGSPALGALAYTQGTDIHVAPGQEKHAAHEAWHVTQQKQGRVRAPAAAAVNDDPALEQEADVMGSKAIQQ